MDVDWDGGSDSLRRLFGGAMSASIRA